MKKMFLILSSLTLISFLANYADITSVLLKVLLKDVSSFSAIFLVLWMFAGNYLKEFRLRRLEMAILFSVLIVNFLVYGAGDWSPLLFVAVPALFIGIVLIKLLTGFLELLLAGSKVSEEPPLEETPQDVRSSVPVTQLV